ncbi:hypothetical protein SH1V18_47650 [Vallitalea longa]|uniref:HMA domain-containing protein n=1 Tax=Vallitalea longa TaxID=2936439 RepID=A0A9W5YGW9_9FIRM|nr:heavy-metal-associated domain-containing protein [Vallitalea longa]GKX32285.1 hypothetical protein SH1V18_47650 [Vallitalea longa]
MQNINIRIDGIKNETEKQHIKNALDKIDGINEIAVNPAKRTIQVSYNPPSTEEEIIECIRSMGHDINYSYDFNDFKY